MPGCWEAQGYPASLEGPAFYQRRFTVPEDWLGRAASLRFEAASYRSRVWLNGRYLGQHEGLWDAFAFEVTRWLQGGRENVLRVEVTKPGRLFPWRETLCGFLPEIAMPFGGLWQPVQLHLHGELALGRPYVRASLRGNAVAVLELHNYSREPRQAELEAEVVDPSGHVVARAGTQLQVRRGRSEAKLAFQVRDPLLWEPATPHQYRLRVNLSKGGTFLATAGRPFGIRDVRASGGQIWLNGRPILLRGVLHWGFYPSSIAPAPGEAEIRAELTRIRELGFNLVKHCLFVPPERYQDLADELGVLLWQELPLWPPTVSPAQRRRALKQLPALVRQRRGHPSLVLYTVGCELNDSADRALLSGLYRAVKRLQPDALVRDNSGSGECYGGLAEDFADFSDYHFYAEPEHLGPLMAAFAAPWRRRRPWLFGEFCDSDTFRNGPAVGNQMERGADWWLSADQERNPLAAQRTLPLLDQQKRLQGMELPCDAEEIKRRSYARSLALRKHVLEQARRSASLSGYVITSLRDVPTVTSGLFDDAGHPKWSSQDFGHFNAETAILLCPMPQRRWIAGGDRLVVGETYCGWGGERFRRALIVSHFGRGPVQAALRWQVEDEQERLVAAGEIERMSLPAGQVQEAGALDFDAPNVRNPQRLTARAWLEGGEGAAHNAWPLWLFPRPAGANLDARSDSRAVRLHDPGGRLGGLGDWLASTIPPGIPGGEGEVLLASCVDETLMAYVQGGGRALVLQTAEGRLPTRRLPFWREGLPLLFPHPALAGIPHDGYADLAWDSLTCELAVDSQSLSRALPGLVQHRPIVRRLDCRDFGITDYAGEVRLGKGRLLYTTLGFERAASAAWGLERCPFASFLLEAFMGWLGTSA